MTSDREPIGMRTPQSTPKNVKITTKTKLLDETPTDKMCLEVNIKNYVFHLDIYKKKKQICVMRRFRSISVDIWLINYTIQVQCECAYA